MASIQVVQLSSPTPEQIDDAARVLEAAFKNDVITNALTGGDPALDFEMFRAHVIATVLAGELHVAHFGDARIVGVAAWFLPGRLLFDSEDQKEAGHNDFVKKLDHGTVKWTDEYWVPKIVAQTDQALGKGYKRNAWHLQLLAVHPDHQGKGVGGSLVKAGEARAFANGKNVCLETQPESRVGMYTHWGFLLKGSEERYESPAGGFPFFVMSKEPPNT